MKTGRRGGIEIMAEILEIAKGGNTMRAHHVEKVEVTGELRLYKMIMNVKNYS